MASLMSVPRVEPEGRLAARNVLDVRRIGHQQLELTLAQDLPYRRPVNPRCLHRDMRAPALRQPRQQGQQPRRRRRESPTLPPVGARASAAHRTPPSLCGRRARRPACASLPFYISPPYLRRRHGGLAQTKSNKRAPGRERPSAPVGGLQGSSGPTRNRALQHHGAPTSGRRH
jgi:hypothetical protein